MQSLEEGDERSSFRRAEIFSVCGHVPAALNHLTNQLIGGQADGDCVQRRPAFSALIIERMAVVALLQLEDQRALPFERRAILQKFGRYGNFTPGVHHRTPGGELSEL